MRNCSTCEIEFEEEYKFCPNCGKSLEEVLEDQQPEETSSTQIICSSCGEENEPDASFCVSCGANLANEQIEIIEKVKPISAPISSAPVQKSNYKRSSSKKKKHPIKNKKVTQVKIGNDNESKNPQDFNTKKIAVVFSSILLFAIVLLYASGVFDEPKISTENFPANNVQQNSGIDLANIDRINQLDAQLKSEPNNYDLLLQLAHLRNDSGFKEEAIKLYTKYLEKFPNNADVLVDMGVCYFDLQQYDQAITPMEKAIKINPTHQIALMNLGIVNLGKGNIEKSKEWLQKAVNLDPNSEIGRKAKELLTSH